MANRSLCIFDNLRDISEEFRPFKRLYNKNEYRSYFNVPLSEICVKKLCQNSVQLKNERRQFIFQKVSTRCPLSVSHLLEKKSERYIFGQRIFPFQMCILDITGNIYIYPRNLQSFSLHHNETKCHSFFKNAMSILGIYAHFFSFSRSWLDLCLCEMIIYENLI